MARTMRAMELEAPDPPLRLVTRVLPQPAPGEVLLEVSAFGVCRTDLHIVDGDLRARLPIVPGQVVGRVITSPADVSAFAAGDRAGVPWVGHTCGLCDYCRRGCENLCDAAEFLSSPQSASSAGGRLVFRGCQASIPPIKEASPPLPRAAIAARRNCRPMSPVE